MAKSQETCKNCELKFKDSFSFCPYCGQQAKDKLTVKVLFYNTISNYFSFDARFFKSLWPLLTKPGFLAAKFIQGKRLLYLHPAQMYLFVAVVFFFLFSFVQRSQVKTLDETFTKTLNKTTNVEKSGDQSKLDSILQIQNRLYRFEDSITHAITKATLKKNKYITGFSDTQIDSLMAVDDFEKDGMMRFDFNTQAVDSLIAQNAPDNQIYKKMGISDDAGYWEKRLYKQALKFYKSRKGGSILQAFYDTIPIAMFFLLPIFAFFLKLLHLKKGSYAHHLVFSFYYFSFLFTAFSIVLGINFIFDVPDLLDGLVILSTFIYLVLAIKYFYREGWLKSAFKSAVLSFVFLSIVTPITFVLLSMFAFLYY